MSKWSLLSLSLLVPASAWAIVDMKSANYSESRNDIVVPGVGYDLRVNLTYHSRSLFNGLFGFGWCSDYETRIDVTTESNLRATECGGGMEITYTPKNFKTDKIEATVDQIIAEVKRRRPDLKGDYITGLKEELKTNDFMREEFGKRMDLKGRPKDGITYLANGRETESIVVQSGHYKRTLSDGTYQLFDLDTGRLTAMYDKNGNHLKLKWQKDLLVSVADNLGRKLTFKYNSVAKKVSEVIGPNGMVATYTVKGEDLVKVVDARKQTYKYKYDDVHNIIRIDLPDGTYKELTYNKDKDWVIAFRNPKGCLETYDYEVSKEDPKNHFWSTVIKKCGRKVTNRSKYEFFHRPRPDGVGVYLYRVRSEVNNNITDIVYHELFGRPISILRDGMKTEYSYYDDGLVKTKKEPGRAMSFEYKNKCRKVSHVTIQFFQEIEEPRSSKPDPRKPAKAEKLVRTIKTDFIYEDKKCNLVLADNSDGQKVKLQYDAKGRISKIEDQAKKLVTIRYESRFGKPWIVTRPGLGTIQVTYKADGEIAKVESKQGPSVAVQVASIFNNLLDIIAPATSEAPI